MENNKIIKNTEFNDHKLDLNDLEKVTGGVDEFNIGNTNENNTNQMPRGMQTSMPMTEEFTTLI